MSDRVNWLLRVDEEVAKGVDARAAAAQVSRNEWLNSALRWVLEQPVQTRATTHEEKV